MANLKNTDLILVGRDGTSFNTQYSDLKDSLSEEYVEKSPTGQASQNINGPLTIATYKVKLNLDGSATFAKDATINGLTVGRGAGNVDTNTALGQNALSSNTTGIYDIAVGRLALRSNTEGTHNIALGHASLRSNITGTYNTAVGQSAGYYIEGSNNTILGAYSGTESDSTLNDTVIISAGKTERMRIDSDGNTEFYGKVTSESTQDSDSGTTLVTKDYLDGTVGESFPEAPADGNIYARKGDSGTWVRALPYDVRTLPELS